MEVRSLHSLNFVTMCNHLCKSDGTKWASMKAALRSAAKFVCRQKRTRAAVEAPALVRQLEARVRELSEELRHTERLSVMWRERATAAEAAMRFQFLRAMKQVCEDHDEKFKTTTSYFWPHV